MNDKTNTKTNTKVNSAAITKQITCKKCGGKMKEGVAMQSTWVAGLPDFPGENTIQTMSEGGPGKLVNCMKCQRCGWSVTAGGGK